MKNQAIIAVLAFTTLMSLSLQSSAELDPRGKDFVERVKEMQQKMDDLAKEAKGKKKSVLASTYFLEATKRAGLSEVDTDRVAQALADGKKEVVTTLLAQYAANGLIESRLTQTQGLDSGLKSLIGVTSRSGKMANSQNPELKLSSADMTSAGQAIERMNGYSLDMLSWSKEHAEQHLKVIEKMEELQGQNEQLSSEEALVLAIMRIYGCSKLKAMEIVKDIKDCV